MHTAISAKPSLPPKAGSFKPVNIFRFYSDLLGTIEQNYLRHGRVFRFQALTDSAVMLGAEATHWGLVTHQKYLSAGRAWEPYIGKLFKGGLLLRDGTQHRHVRKLLMPAFRQEALQFYLASCEDIIDQHLLKWPDNCPDIYPRVKELTLEIAIRAFFGISHPKDLKIYNTLLTQVVAGSISINRIPFLGRSYHLAKSARLQLVALLKPLVQQRRQKTSEDMMGQLCQSRDDEGKMLSDDEIIDQMIFIMMAAHDTTASTLASLFYELALQPQWQERIRDETQASAHIALAQRPEAMALTQMTLKETLRRNSPLKVIPRVALEDLEFNGFHLRKGKQISFFPAFSHTMPEYWSKPQLFDPLRFSPERNEHKRQAYAYAPFGGGLHTCLGQFFAEKFLAIILGKITLARSWTIPEMHTRKFTQIPIHVPKGPLPVTFTRS